VLKTPENETKQAIKKYLMLRNDICLTSNPSGNAYTGKLLKFSDGQVTLGFPRRLSFGVFNPGGPDMIGLKTVRITPDMVGKDIGVFMGIEIKRAEGGKLTVEQAEVLGMISARGGISGCVSSVEEFIKLC
jgi:hypothetical protein